jgi:uncharacterized membrane protein
VETRAGNWRAIGAASILRPGLLETELGALHPIVVHFALALLVAGVLFRCAWLIGALLRSGRLGFAGPTAAVLLLAGTLAAALAVKSGELASGDAEGIPGAAAAVEEHEEWAEWTLRLFVVVSLLEASALALRRSGRLPPALRTASGILGLAGLFLVYETGEHGGQLVYSHAAGVGTRSGDPRDVGRLLLAGLYQQSVLDRTEGRTEEARGLLELAAARFPEHVEVQLLVAEFQLEDEKDPARALATLRGLTVPKDDGRLRLRHGILTVDALLALDRLPEARATLEQVRREAPDSGLVQIRLQRLQGAAAPAVSPP